MEIPRTPTGSILQTKESTLVINKLQTGQFLQAKIVDQLPNKSDVIIRLGNQLLQVKSDIPVTIGQTIKVLVEKTASEVILKVKPPSQSNNLINSSLRQLLPKQTPVNHFQQPLSQIFTSINKQAIKSAHNQSKELAPHLMQIKRLAFSIIQALPSQKNITTSEGIKSAIQNSGFFLEPKLQQLLLENKAAFNTNTDNSKANQKPSMEPSSTKTVGEHTVDLSRIDVKASLIKLIKLLNTWPKNSLTPHQQTAEQQKKVQQTTLNPLTISLKPTIATPPSTAHKIPLALPQLLEQQIKELISKTEGAISKITLNQLASTNIDNISSRQTWQIEVPFLNQNASESIFLKIEQDEAPHKKNNKMDSQWTVSLEMNPPKLGLIKNKLTLNNHRISSSFWAEESETRNLIFQHLSSFKEQLSRANIKTDSIQLQKGTGPVIQSVKVDAPILSEKA